MLIRIACLIAAAGFFPSPPTSARAQPNGQQRPNILLLVSDDQRPDTIHALGNQQIRTGVLDRLVARGTSFTRAISPNPLCVPARAEILTGCRGFTNGILPGFTSRLNDSLPLWPEVMRESGYETWHVGKWHVAGRPSTRGYDDSLGLFAGSRPGGTIALDGRGRPITGYRGWRFQDDDGRLAPNEPSGLTGDISAKFADAAIELLERKTDRPFFLHVNFTAPHDPLIMPPGVAGIYDPAEIELPVDFAAEHPFDHGNLRGRDELLWSSPRSAEEARADLATYYAVLTDLDTQIGRILAALAATGKDANTIVIFTSDHGLAIGSHGLRGKQNMYEHTIGIPLVIAGPGIRRGVRTDTQVYLRDLFPTVCDLAGIAVPVEVEGESFQGALVGGEYLKREAAFGYFNDAQRMIRTERWKLIAYPRIGRYQLFDLANDPHERNDLADDPRYAQKREALIRELADWHQQVADPLVRRDG